MAEKHYRTCNLCEAICGIEIEHAGGEILSIKGDKNDPFSRGHICPKALALKEVYEDANRLKTPVKRTGNEWREISWREAFDEIAAKIGEIQTKYGRNAVAVYQGNPSVRTLSTVSKQSKNAAEKSFSLTHAKPKRRVSPANIFSLYLRATFIFSSL